MSVSANNKAVAGYPCTAQTSAWADARRVLLVEEQAHVVRVIRHNLERCGFQVESSANTDGALQLMMADTFDALIMTSEQSAVDIRALCMRCPELLAGHVLLDPVKSVAKAPLMLVCCDEADDLAQQLPGFERLSHPVSLKYIVGRLGEALCPPDVDQPH